MRTTAASNQCSGTHDAADVPVAPPQPAQCRPRFKPCQPQEIAVRALHERLRTLTAEYGVSHETVRAMVRRVGSAGTACVV